MVKILNEFEVIRKANFDSLTWNSKEMIFRMRSKFRSKLLKGYEIPFYLAIETKFRKSIFGTYLEEFNYQQNQNKELNLNKIDITKWNMKTWNSVEMQIFNENNNASDDLFLLLLRAVNENECITWEFLYENLITLRLVDFHITTLDRKMRNFRNLRVLILNGNWIDDVPGKYLPRGLQFLECFGNQISTLRNFCRDTPCNTLLHIGFGRNQLTDESKIRRLEKCGKFSTLRTLDLSENDIYYIEAVLQPLKALKMLTGLHLEGNPCATCIAYKDAVVKALPQLISLDNTQLLPNDKNIKEIPEENLHNAALTFTCHRIMGLPAPTKEKGLTQTIHLEVTLPLLEEICLEPLEPEVEDEVENTTADKGKDAKQKDPKSDQKSSNKSSKTDKGVVSSLYDAMDEYEKERKSRIRNTAFKTDRKEWAKIIQFPEEALVIESPEKNLTAIRDSFRSRVNVKIIYLKIQPPEVPKKGKEAANQKQSKGNVVQPAEEPKKPVEKILKKVTLANFFCDLHTVNWSDKTIDYYWADHSKCKPTAIPMDGSLRAINYIEGKKGGSEKSKSDKGGTENELVKVPSKQFLPTMFTCQLGFGLKRS